MLITFVLAGFLNPSGADMPAVMCRAFRMMRIGLLAGDLRTMHRSSTGALLSGAASVRVFQLVASVLTLLFTTSSIVSAGPCVPSTVRLCQLAIMRCLSTSSWIVSVWCRVDCTMML